MDFFDRYTQLCAKHHLRPSSQEAADAFKVTRATIVSWNKRGNFPKGDVLIRMANKFGVSVDYLLGRPTVAGVPLPAPSHVQSLYDRLDATDQARLEAYAEGMLTSDKYRAQAKGKIG